jgi:two-component system chemotaxis response regulator CheB
MPSAPAARRDATQATRALPRILVIDDSAVARAVIGQLIGESRRYSVAGAFAGVAGALAFLAAERVDLILLDIAMPGTDGLTALPDVLAAGRGARIVIVSSSAADGAAATVQALALGAADTLAKPGGPGEDTARFRAALLAKLDRLCPPEGRDRASPATLAPPANPAIGLRAFDCVAIGASTGGIHALGMLLGALPPSFVVPIVVTQHLPISFMPYFAAQLATLGKRPCDVATDRMRIRPGRIVVAPGDRHIRLVALPDGTASVRLVDEPAASGCMPSVDPMFASLGQVFGNRGLAIVLSGMGRDGADGARTVRDAGGSVVVQDEASSVVWGMPGAVAGLGLADAVLPPAVIGTLVAASRRP